MSLFKALHKIAAESFFKENDNCKTLLGRDEIGELSEEDYAIFDAIAKAEQEAAALARIPQDLEDRRLAKERYANMIAANQAALLSHNPAEKKITKSLLNKMLVWNQSRWGHRKADIVDCILNFEKRKGTAYYVAGTYTEKTGCHGQMIGVYVDYDLRIIAKIKNTSGDVHDFDTVPILAENILEIYKMI